MRIIVNYFKSIILQVRLTVDTCLFQIKAWLLQLHLWLLNHPVIGYFYEAYICLVMVYLSAFFSFMLISSALILYKYGHSVSVLIVSFCGWLDYLLRNGDRNAIFTIKLGGIFQIDTQYPVLMHWAQFVIFCFLFLLALYCSKDLLNYVGSLVGEPILRFCELRNSPLEVKIKHLVSGAAAAATATVLTVFNGYGTKMAEGSNKLAEAKMDFLTKSEYTSKLADIAEAKLKRGHEEALLLMSKNRWLTYSAARAQADAIVDKAFAPAIEALQTAINAPAPNKSRYECTTTSNFLSKSVVVKEDTPKVITSNSKPRTWSEYFGFPRI